MDEKQPDPRLDILVKINSVPQTSERSVRVLFFGRSGWEGTQKASDFLKKLGCKVTFVESSGRGEALPEDLRDWNGEFIFCLRSLFVLPKDVLDKATIAAVNFHPGPVDHPGSAGISFALYEGDTNFGVTAHIMNERVDNGPILECRRFPILPEDSVDTLLQRTHFNLLDLFLDIVEDLVARRKEALDKMIMDSSESEWVGDARKMKDLDELQVIKTDITEEELQRVIRATYTKEFPPTINLYGYEFSLNSPSKTA